MKSRSTAKPRWSPTGQVRLRVMFAKLLRIAAAPEDKISGRRKRFLERQLFYGSEAAKGAYAKRFYDVATAVVLAAAERNPTEFARADRELTALWREYLAAKPSFGVE